MPSFERSDARLDLSSPPDQMPQLEKMSPLDTPPPALANFGVAPASLARPRRLGGEMHAQMEAEMEAEMEELEKSLCTPSTMQALEKDLCCTPSTMQELQNFLDYSTNSNASPSEIAMPEVNLSLGFTPTSCWEAEGDLSCSTAAAAEPMSQVVRWQAAMRVVLSRGDLAENNHRLLAPLVTCAAHCPCHWPIDDTSPSHPANILLALILARSAPTSPHPDPCRCLSRSGATPLACSPRCSACREGKWTHSTPTCAAWSCSSN